ncbi:(deoxy)nucleoside triphosphate pyrophosphohydrolase [Sporosarcina luteola]|uniref:(deoxy)nucleoside triphosphate pyrophosphohydrolase n=1 Tax=Sporosarcina luteola TaxID=582850 RepID=UPI00203B62AE|nr:(deoxy)nucleoside triphosphate pyrophosphohydrolase [Sporosarcina luteola]MCM3745099.1 (deoxy)nucleoside triphosphate pyrophosphohydrolase [Sporosarcina luteola]
MIQVAAAIIVKMGKLLITKRSESMSLPNLWEFPGGKLKEDESPEDCVVREIREELKVDITVLRYFTTTRHKYDFGEIELIAYVAELDNGKITLTEHSEFKWVDIRSLCNYEFAPADIPIIKKLEEEGIWDLIQG